MARTRLPAVLWPLMAGNLVIETGAQWRSFCLLGMVSLSVPSMPLGLSDGELVGGRLAFGIVGLLFLLSAASAWQSITTGVKPCTFFTVNSRPYHPVPRSDALGPRCRLIFGRRVHSVVMLCALCEVTPRPDSGSDPAPVCMAVPVRVSG